MIGFPFLFGLVAATSGVTVNIARKSLTAVYAGVNRVYDGTTAATASANNSPTLSLRVRSVTAATNLS